jgi:ligand-binding sensor domain-containing protein/putative methionine-R-sulfoxide reductase with GAF domain
MHQPHILRVIMPLLCLCILIRSHAQMPAFYHLSTADGLSDNSVNSVCRDRNGMLWIGTTEGLNSFDGHVITNYYKDQYPAIDDNNILQVVCDKYNRIWLRNGARGIAMLDERRRFHAFRIGDSSERRPTTALLTTHSRGPIALIGNLHFIKDSARSRFIPFTFSGDTLLPRSISCANYLDADKIIFCGENRLVVIDYAKLVVLLNIPLPGIVGAARINDAELLAYTARGDAFYRVSLTDKKISTVYSGFRDQHGQPITGELRDISHIDNNSFAITTRFAGVYHLDIAQQKLQRWYHDPVNPRSIGGDNTSAIRYDSSGYLFISTRTSGLHYFNMRQPFANHLSYFRNENNEIFDGFVQSICEDDAGQTWLGTQDRLICRNRLSGKTSFVNYSLPNGQRLHREETIRSLAWVNGALWIGTTRHGMLVIDKNGKTIAHLYDSAAPGHKVPSNWINSICRRNERETWIATSRGVYRVTNDTYKADDLSHNPGFAKMGRPFCNNLWFDSKQRLWVGGNIGAWCYDAAKDSLRFYNSRNGLSHNRVFCFNEDNNGNIYIGTAEGLTVIDEKGAIQIYTRRNGLRNNKCEGILKDAQGFLWIGNLNCILRFDPQTKKFAAFEEGWGFSHAGFRMRSSFQNTSGEMFWGSDKGLTWFLPQMMNQVSTRLHPAIHGLAAGDSAYRFTTGETLYFPYNSPSFTFQFSSGELTAGNRIQFLCRLAGFDKEWKPPAIHGQVAYNNLPPGHYRFEIKASRDGDNWYEGSFPVAIIIRKPWWQQTWFRFAGLLLACGMLYSVYRYAKYRRQAAETQRMIAYFTNSGYEHSSVDDILWDICRNCISRLKFEDCVIYLLDTEKNVLVQKAAYGPKNSNANEIVNPLVIPLGLGIVGNVAQTGNATIVNDTSKDERYIVDDERRNSEITVPLVHEGKVIGIIDSEHPKKHFFTKQHLQTLQTIASLCSANISRAMAMDAMKKSRLELLELNIKMAESKFMNLRLQMNPHFLFNSLSSIQHLIVSQQTTRAYKYLTLFSNFLRSLLGNAEKNFILLDEELKILQMYIELESLRFDQSFQYSIDVDESLAAEEVLVPPLMVQPFAENAIWHGLLHKEGEKKLSIRFYNHADDHLTCTIEDNGIGRTQAAIIRSNNYSAMTHESKGIGIIRERLVLLAQKTGKPASVSINDLYDSNQHATGTQVLITIPYYNPEDP